MITNYASFGKRFVASIIDNIIINALTLALSFLIGSSVLDPITSFGIVIGLSLLLFFGYFGYFESSENQATPGKSVMKIKVTDLAGNRISFGKAVFRTIMKIVSSIILLIGYIMAAFTEKKQALHDMAASTLVLDTATSKNLNTTV